MPQRFGIGNQSPHAQLLCQGVGLSRCKFGRLVVHGGGALKALFWIYVVCLLDYYSICLSEWENNIYISIRRIFGRVAKFEHNVSGSKVLTYAKLKN